MHRVLPELGAGAALAWCVALEVARRRLRAQLEAVHRQLTDLYDRIDGAFRDPVPPDDESLF